jgi:hypothetical protein
VGAYNASNGQTAEGRVYVYQGSASGLASSAAWTFESNQSFAALGIDVSGAGDVNGDGFSDVIAGADGYTESFSYEGKAWVFPGSATGLASAAIWSGRSNQASAAFGHRVASAGDSNGDGFGDILVSAHGYDNGQTDEGTAWLYLGSASGPATLSAWSVESDQASSEVGSALGSAGDVNGDGFADAIVGIRQFDYPETDEGAVFVFLGTPGGLTPGAQFAAYVDQSYAYLGVWVAAAGDVNGDGFGDVLAGASGWESGEADEGLAQLWYGAPAGLATLRHLDVESNQASSSFGWSVASAGDVDADGYDEFLVGSHQWDNGSVDEGRAWLYKGSATGVSSVPWWTAEPDQALSAFGFAVAGAGDLNGDGYADVAVGAPWFDGGPGAYSGLAQAFLGSLTGLASTADWSVAGAQSAAGFGVSVAAAGDVDGDGYGDLVVGEYFYDNGENDEGRALLFAGSESGLATTAAWDFEGEQLDGRLGTSVGGGGDANGDGYADVIVGSHVYDASTPNDGRAWGFLGSPSGLSPTSTWVVDGGQSNANFAFSLAFCGDLNGDGFGDVAVGAPLHTASVNAEGRVRVYLGTASGLATAPGTTLDSGQFQAHFGESVAAAGDVDGDGYGDLVVGAPFLSSGQTEEGRACLFRGTTSGLHSAVAWTFEADQSNANAGVSVASAGDLNGDGFGDVVLGAHRFDNPTVDEGRAWVFLGGAELNGGGGSGGLHPAPMALSLFRADAATPLSPWGFTESADSVAVEAFARPPLGRSGVALEWEVKPLGTPFDGTGLGWSGAYSDSGTAGLPLAETISGLPEGSAQHLRVRLRYDPADGPAQRHSPWSYAGRPGDASGVHFVTSVHNEPPTALDDELTVSEGAAGSVDVLQNDSDPDGPLSYGDVQILDEPLNGVATLSASALDYQHDGSETIEDSITYEVCDDGTTPLCEEAVVDVVVLPVNDLPVVAGAGSFTGDEGESISLDFSGTSDPDSPSLIYRVDCELDGVWDSEGSSPLSACTFADDGSFLGTMQVDDGQATVNAELSFTVGNVAPYIVTSAPTSAMEGVPYSYQPAADDPGGASDPLLWSLSAGPPAMTIDGASGGVGWLPEFVDAGQDWLVQVDVDDGDGGTDSEAFTISVAFVDDDADGLPDTWEAMWGLDPGDPTDPGEDPDGDGLDNAAEYALGQNPNSYDGPAVPTLLSPISSALVADLNPTLSAEAVDPQAADTLLLDFELYADAGLSSLVGSGSSMPVLSGTPGQWTVSVDLVEDGRYYWRARASDGSATTSWSAAESFLVSLANDPPPIPLGVYPQDSSLVAAQPLILLWAPVDDPEGDDVHYTVELRDAGGFPVEEAADLPSDANPYEEWELTTVLAEDESYSWTVQSFDESGATLGPNSPPWTFVFNGVDAPPEGAAITSPEDGAVLEQMPEAILAQPGVDPEGTAVSHLMAVDLVPTFDSPGMVEAAPSAGAGPDLEFRPQDLSFAYTEDTWFWVRIVATDEGGISAPPHAITFRWKGENDPPPAPEPVSPADGETVSEAFPVLVVANVEEPDLDPVSYEFLVTRDEAGTLAFAGELGVAEGSDGTTSWTIPVVRTGDVFWKARALDSEGLAGGYSPPRLLRLPADGDDDDASSGDDDADDDVSGDDDGGDANAAPGCALDCGSMAGAKPAAGWALSFALLLALATRSSPRGSRGQRD